MLLGGLLDPFVQPPLELLHERVENLIFVLGAELAPGLDGGRGLVTPDQLFGHGSVVRLPDVSRKRTP